MFFLLGFVPFGSPIVSLLDVSYFILSTVVPFEYWDLLFPIAWLPGDWALAPEPHNQSYYFLAVAESES